MPKVRKTFDMQAWQAEQQRQREERQREERQREAARIHAIKTEIRALVPDDTIAISVKVTRPHSGNRFMSLTDITGDKDSVYRYARNQFGSDHVTQCYEHMALTLYDVVTNEDGTITARFSKNMYAGD